MPDLSSLGLVAFAFLVILPVISLVLLIMCWLFGDVGLVVKIVLTVVFLASFGLLFTKVPQLFMAAQGLLCFVVGFATFFTYWIPPSKGRGRGIVRD
jgi:cytosine/uracil/thiamine/allantoin permease